MKRLALLLVGLVGVASAYGSSHSEVSEPFTIDGVTYQVTHYWESSDWIVPAPRHNPSGPKKGVVGPGSGGTYHSYTATVVGAVESLTGANIPQTVNYWDRDINVVSVGANAFKGLLALAFVNMPYISSVKESAFEGCPNLMSLKVGPDLKIGKKAFANCSNLLTIETVVQASSRASRILVFSSVTSVGESAFAGCEKLTTQYFPQKVGLFENNAYENCKSIRTVRVPDFRNCEGSGTLGLKNNVFKGCSKIDDVYTEYPSSIPENTFDETTYQNAMLHVPLGQIEVYKNLTGWKKFRHFTDEVTTEGVQSSTFVANTAEGVEMTFTVYDAENKKCNVGGGTYYNTAVATTTSGTVTIPSSINGYEVTGINEYAFCGCDKLTGIVVPEGVTDILYAAFAGCESLNQIALPNSLTHLSSYAFYGCSSLSEVFIPKNVKNIEDWLFAGSCGVRKLTVDADNPYFYSMNNCILVDYNADGETVGVVGFACAGSTIPTAAKVKQIGLYAFEEVSGIKEIQIPDNITAIGQEAFCTCSDLETVTIGRNVSIIQPFAFCDNKKLREVYALNPVPVEISDNVFHTQIVWNEDESFNTTKDFTTATLYVPAGSKAAYQQAAGWKNFQNIVEMEPDELKNGDLFTAPTAEGVEMTFMVRDTESKTCWVGSDTGSVKAVVTSTSGVVTIPSSANGYEVKGISPYAFLDCDKLTSIIVPESVDSITYGAFARCHSLTQMKLPNSLKHLWSFAFYDCSNLVSVSLGNRLETMGEAAFYGCTSLSSLDLPSSLTAIYSSAFRDCSSLSEMHIPENVSYLEDWLFAGSCGVQKLTVDADNPYFYSMNNCILADHNANGETVGVVGFACAGSTIPTVAKVKQIGQKAFAAVSGIKEILIPDNITAIGLEAFCRCSDLETVTIGRNVSLIQPLAFSANEKLREVYVLNPIAVDIADNVFHTEITVNNDGTYNSSKNFTTATLYVPYGSKAAYQQAAGWKNFQSIVEIGAPNITVSLDESSKLTGNWYATNSWETTGSKDEIHINTPVYGQSGVNVYDWQYPVFSAFRKGQPQLTVSGADASEVTPLLAFRSVGVLQAGSDGDALLCYADTIAKVDSETGEMTMVMSASTKRLLNQAASDDFVNALTLPLCIKARYNGTVYDVEGSDFSAKVMRPINAEGKELAQQDITTGSVTLNLSELVALTDWRDYSINKRGLFDFYDIESITVTGATNSSNVGSVIKANVSGSWVSVSSTTDKLTFTYQPRSLWDNADGVMPDYGTLTVANNGFSGDMQLSIPVTVRYAWGEVQTTAYVTVTAEAEEPDLKVEEFYVEGDGIVGTLHSICCKVKNYGATYTGRVYLHSKLLRATVPASVEIWNSEIPKGFLFTSNRGVYFVEEGTFRIWLSTDEEGNDVIGEIPWSVTPAATLTAKSYTREYGEENPDFGFTADKGGFSGAPEISCEADRYSDVGTYPIIIEQGSVDNNYVTYVKGTLTITPAMLTVKAQDWLSRQGLEPSGIMPKYENFKNGEDKSVLTREPQFTTTATASSPMGSVHQLTFSGAEAKNYLFNYIPGTITIIGRPGDVNRDSYVNTTDVVDAVQFIFGYPNVQTIFDADLDDDEEVTTTDVTRVVYYVMTNDRAAARLKTPAATMTNSVLGLSQDGQNGLAVSLKNDVPLVAFQFDVVVPDGADISRVLLSESRKNGHALAMKQMEDGRYRVLAYSMQNNSLLGSEGLLATMQVNGLDGEIVLTNVHVTDAQLTDHRLPDVSLTVLTGISTLVQQERFNIYDLNGRLVRRDATSTKGLHRGVYMINNQKVVIK